MRTFGAYYTWINLHRLTGTESATFMVWSEPDRQAVATGPGLPRGVEAPNPVTLERLLRLIVKA